MTLPTMPTTLKRSILAFIAILASGCSDATGPVELVPVYRDDAFYSHVVYESETELTIGVSQVLELHDGGTAVRTTHVRHVDKATLDEWIEEYALEMTYELDGDRVRTSAMPCTAEVCPLALMIDPPDYLVRDGGDRLVELTSPEERRTYRAFLVTNGF